MIGVCTKIFFNYYYGHIEYFDYLIYAKVLMMKKSNKFNISEEMSVKGEEYFNNFLIKVRLVYTINFFLYLIISYTI